MREMIAKSRLTRGLAAIGAVAIIYYFLGDLADWKKLVIGVATAFFAWVATCEIEVFKKELTLANNELDWKRGILASADASLFDLKTVFEDSTMSIAFKPAGETDEQWHTRAGAAWTASVDEMTRVRRDVWKIRTFLENHEDLDNQIQSVSRGIRSIIWIHKGFMAKNGAPLALTAR